MPTFKLKKTLPILLILAIFGCDKSVRVIANLDKPESIELLCNGTWYIDENSKNWDSPKHQVFKEDGRAYTATKDYPIYDQNHKKDLVWRLSSPNSVEYPAQTNYSDAPGKPSHFETVRVDRNSISVYSQYKQDYENISKDEGMNQKHESTKNITINRFSGDWSEVTESTTYWKNGSWLTRKSTYIGKCEKAKQKF